MNSKLSLKGLLSVFFLFSVFASVLSATAQTIGASPETTAMTEHLRIFKDYLAAFNAGDAEGLKKFAAEALSETS
jgi:hypothetical protein